MADIKDYDDNDRVVIRNAARNTNHQADRTYTSANNNIRHWFINGVGSKVGRADDEMNAYIKEELDRNVDALDDKPALKTAFEDGLAASVEFDPALLDGDRSTYLADGFDNVLRARGFTEEEISMVASDRVGDVLDNRIAGCKTVADLHALYEEYKVKIEALNHRRNAALRKRKQRRVERGSKIYDKTEFEKEADEAYAKEHERLYNTMKNINATVIHRTSKTSPIDLIAPPPMISDMDDGTTLGCKTSTPHISLKERADFLTRGIGVSFVEQGRMMNATIMDGGQLSAIINDEINNNDLYLATAIGDMLRAVETPQQVFLLAQAQKILRERNNPQMTLELEREKVRLRKEAQLEIMRTKVELSLVDNEGDDVQFLLDNSGIER